MFYVKAIQECLTLLDTALAQVQAELPQDIHKEHYIKNKHSPSAWMDVYTAHMTEAEEKPELVTALFATVAVLGAQTMLASVVSEVERIRQPPPSLKLGKMRR